MKQLSVRCMIAIAVLVMASGCSTSAPPPSPTVAPAAPTKAVEATKAPVAEPTKPPAAAPTAVPVAKVDYPQKGKPITFIVPFGPGGSPDTASRVLGPLLEQELGAPMQVLNKAGASTQTGITDLVNSKPDGYTFAVTTGATIVTYLDPERKAAYTGKSLLPVANISTDDLPLAVRSDSAIKTLKDLVDQAKAKPGQLKGGTAGLMTPTHLAALALGQAAGVQFAAVHFPGAADAATALLGGHIDFMSVSPAATLPHFKSGAARVLGTFSKEESKIFTGVKTVEAQGYKASIIPFTGILAPAGTPKEIVDRMSGAIGKIMSSASVRDRLNEGGIKPTYMDSVQFGAFWNEQEAMHAPLVELAKKQQQ